MGCGGLLWQLGWRHLFPAEIDAAGAQVCLLYVCDYPDDGRTDGLWPSLSGYDLQSAGYPHAHPHTISISIIKRTELHFSVNVIYPPAPPPLPARLQRNISSFFLPTHQDRLTSLGPQLDPVKCELQRANAKIKKNKTDAR